MDDDDAGGRRGGARARSRIRAAEAFSAFPPAAAAALREAAVHRVWSNGSIVVAKGHVVPWITAILRGRVRIVVSTDDGHEVFFRWQMPGEILGMVSAVAGLPLPVDAVAFDDCETLQVGRERLLALMEADAQVATTAARLVARHAYDLVNLIAARTEPTLTARVLGVLRHLALLNGRPYGATARTLAVSQQDIAAAVGASRQRVNTELRTLERSGQIALGYRQVIVFGLPAAGAPITPLEER